MLLPLLRNRFAASTDPLWGLRRDIDRLFDNVWDGYSTQNGMTWAPAMDVLERENEIQCTFELPGLSPDDVEITVENGVLTVSGERKYEEDKEQNGTRYTERRYGRFQRSFTLPEHVDSEQISAKFENGVLTLTLPKSAQARARRIQIGAGNGQKQIQGTEQKRVESGKSERRVA